MQIDPLGPALWRELLDHRAPGSLSFYLPTHAAGAAVQQNPTRLKNLLRQAEELLLEDGVPARGAQEALAPVRSLCDDPLFWRLQGEGLAVFLAPGVTRTLRLPMAVPERVTRGPRFMLKPLLPLQFRWQRFRVLALSLNAVRVLAGTADRAERVDVAGLPASFEDALGYEEFDASLQAHTSSSRGLGRQPAIFHGHGDADEERLKDDILRYFQLVDQALRPTAGEPKEPLVLAAAERHFPLFRRANSHPGLLEEGIRGNPEGLSDHELHRRAWEVVEPWLRRSEAAALRTFEELEGSGKTLTGPRDILPAASQGRVDTLLVAGDEEEWGILEEGSGEVEVHGVRRAGDQELLDAAAVLTLQRGGQAYAVAGERLPRGAAAAAILRY